MSVTTTRSSANARSHTHTPPHPFSQPGDPAITRRTPGDGTTEPPPSLSPLHESIDGGVLEVQPGGQVPRPGYVPRDGGGAGGVGDPFGRRASVTGEYRKRDYHHRKQNMHSMQNRAKASISQSFIFRTVNVWSTGRTTSTISAKQW